MCRRCDYRSRRGDATSDRVSGGVAQDRQRHRRGGPAPLLRRILAGPAGRSAAGRRLQSECKSISNRRRRS